MDDDTRGQLEQLRRRMDMLAAPLEDALAHRIYEKALDQFKKWLLGWAAVATTLLLFLGYQGYKEVVDQGRKDASEFVRKSAVASLQNDIRKELQSARDQVKQSFQQNALADASKLDQDLAKILSDTQSNIDTRLSTFATQLAAATRTPTLSQAVARPPQPPLRAYAYYGIQTNTGWSERNFAQTSGDPAQPPKPGDLVRAIMPVNARSAVIKYVESRGWVNAQTVGLVKEGRTVRVLSVRPVEGASAFLWIEFETT